ncbi:MAG: DinB family protein [Microthrixaceae bacterium]
MDVNGDLYSYLQGARETLLWKLDGLGEYDSRRPMTPTGTNLLGLVKHSARSHLMYFCDVFDRPQDPSLRWLSDVTPGSDMWAKHDESTDDIVAAYRRSWQLADETVMELPSDAFGRVPWWGDDPVTIERVVVHLTAETQRHAGHADIVRELIDGSAGLLNGFDNLRVGDPAERARLYDEIERAAEAAASR